MQESCVIGAYASRGAPEPTLPFYPLLFANVVVRFIQCSSSWASCGWTAIRDLTRWSQEAGSFTRPRGLPLEQIATAHELVEQGASSAR